MAMRLAGWIRDRLWRASDWPAELAQLRAAVAAEPRTARTSERTLDLARATDEIDPDRGRALALYLDAWRGGHAGAFPRAKALAIQLRAHVTLAELALGAGDLVTAATAYLDAGLPQLAIDPLRRSAGVGAPRTHAVLLALAERKRVDAPREIADALAAHTAEGCAHAARLARLAKLDERIPAILAAGMRSWPDDPVIAALVETRLLEAGNVDHLLEHYRAGFERAPTRATYCERVLAAGLELIARNLGVGLGLRLVRMGLEQGYEAHVPEPIGHIAAWELIGAHARAQQSVPDLVPLLVQAMAAPLSDDVALYLARLGLEIAWREVGDLLAAQPYAAAVLDFVPDHPLALAFAKELPPPPPPPLPVPPPTFAAATSRIPALDQGQVKRVPEPAAEVSKTPTGRLALLKPPPPRATSLERDTSPFPVARARQGPTAPRAPRIVLPVDAVIELPSGEFFTTLLRDVSASGAFIITKRRLEIGAIVSLELKIPLRRSIHVAKHRTAARIARHTELGCGLAFIDPTPELIAAIRAAAH